MSHIVTRASLIAMLDSADHNKRQHIVGRALVHLYNRQTCSEQAVGHTRSDNGVGFTPADARWGTVLAEFYIKKNRLSEKQVAIMMKKNARGIPKIAKYWKQLDEEAQRKRNAA